MTDQNADQLPDVETRRAMIERKRDDSRVKAFNAALDIEAIGIDATMTDEARAAAQLELEKRISGERAAAARFDELLKELDAESPPTASV